MAEQKEYFAFISYQRKDEEWAEWLREKLEHYHLPSSIRKQNPSFPKEIRPIFRDALELAGGVLAEEIQTALQQSKYLIVICSPNSAKSPWVNKEIQTFIDLGRENYIIPFIIDGTPFSDDGETECFPPALRLLKGEKELLGININELSRDAAFIKVVARMFGLKFDTLWQRYEREKKRKRWMVIGGALLFSFVSLSIGWYIALQNSMLKEKDWKMKENQARAVAEKANQLIDEGDSYLARMLLMEVMSSDRPYIPETEYALRRAYDNDNAILRGHTGEVYSATYSPNGTYIVSSSFDGTIRIWYAATGAQKGKPLTGHTSWVNSAAFSPDGKRIVSASEDSTVRIWNAKSGEQIGKPLKRHTNSVNSAVFSPDPDGKYIVSTSWDKTIRIWDAQTGQIHKTLEYTNYVNSAAFSPDGKQIVSAAGDNTIRFWNTITGQQIGEPLKGHTSSINSVAFSPDPNGKYIVSASSDSTVRIWNAKSGEQIGKPLKGHTSSVNSAAFSPDPNGKYIVSASSDSTIRIWNAKTGKQIGVPLKGHTNKIHSVAFCPNTRHIVSASLDNTIRIWNIKKKEPICLHFEKYTGEILSINFSLDGKRIVSASADSTIRIWDVFTGKQVGQAIKTISKDFFVAFSPSGKHILSLSSGGFGCIRIWDVDSGKVYRTLVVDFDGIRGWVNNAIFVNFNYASFSQDGKYIVSAHQDNTTRIWDVEKGKCIHTFKGHTNMVTFASLCSSGKRIVSAAQDSTVRIWDVESKKQIGEPLLAHKAEVNSAFFSPDGKQIVSASNDNTIRIWDVQTGKLLQTMEGHTNSVNTASFSPDGKRVVSASNDKTIRIWDAQTGQLIQTLEGHNSSVKTATFSPDGKKIVSASADKTVRIWDFPPLQQLIDETRERFKNRPLTPEERRKYYLE